MLRPWVRGVRRRTSEWNAALATTRPRVESAPGVVRRTVGGGARGAGGHGDLVGEGHHRARNLVGGGGARPSAGHPRRRQAAAVFGRVRRHRCLQREDDETEEGPVARRGAPAPGRCAPPPDRPRSERAGDPGHRRNALSPSPAARYLWPLPEARATSSISCRRAGRHPSSKPSTARRGSSSCSTATRPRRGPPSPKPRMRSSRSPGRSRSPPGPPPRPRSSPCTAAPCSITSCIIAASSRCTSASTALRAPRCTVPPRTSRTSKDQRVPSWEQAVSGLLRALRLDSIRSKMLVFALLATLIPSVTTGWISYLQNERSLSAKITGELQGVSAQTARSEEHTSELQSLAYLVCRLLL